MIYFVRHGESEANVRGVFAGQRDDSLLTAKGREQAKATAATIKAQSLHFDAVISSPLKRTLETAHIIMKELGIDPTHIRIDQRISEYNMGDLTGTPLTHVSSIKLISAKNAENVDAFKKRICDCLQELARAHENVLVVSHGGVGRMLENTLEGKEPKLFYDRPVWGNASVTKIDWIK